jgi:acyl-CoA ligase (AMP-forming) (exosortase A-associated)
MTNMPTLVHELLTTTARTAPQNTAIRHKGASLTFGELAERVANQAQALAAVGLKRQQRVAIYLPKQVETVLSFLAVAEAGGVFVPVNPVLKADQVAHILRDCNVQILVTSHSRLAALGAVLADCPDLHTLIVTDAAGALPEIPGLRILHWNDLAQPSRPVARPPLIDTDMAAILYTSGSTGKPKGVVLSHRNIVAGAKSVAQYLDIAADDRILAVLPFSFDYGLNQLTAALLKGACCVLMDYLLPRDVIGMVAKERITGLAAVPPLWVQLAQLEWPAEIDGHLRYMTNSGGKMPKSALAALRRAVPSVKFFLMYGLTEAFRSTYLPPDQIDLRPDSIGKAIPNAEILVVREDGSPCAPHEPGELVHRGSLVAMGYWNDPHKTAERFRPCPGQLRELPLTEMAVWSGDTVSMDEDGYLYFVGRKDDMIKTSGYRVSPTEVEEVIYATGLVGEAAVVGIEHPALGQAIVAIVTASQHQTFDRDALLAACREKLPNFMVPAQIHVQDSLPRNPNGKIDRKQLAQHWSHLFAEAGA